MVHEARYNTARGWLVGYRNNANEIKTPTYKNQRKTRSGSAETRVFKELNVIFSDLTLAYNVILYNSLRRPKTVDSQFDEWLHRFHLGIARALPRQRKPQQTKKITHTLMHVTYAQVNQG